MKTLDEVIREFESGYLITDKTKNDTLHYLKEYQRDKQIFAYDIAKRNMELSECNDPLTWDELKGMEGKPVWVEALLYKQWAVIGYVGENHIRFEGVNLYAPESRTYMGAEDGWQAYRQERE